MFSTDATITILSTGGTIEKGYNEHDGSLLNRGSVLEAQILSQLRLAHTRYRVEVLMSKDSLEMSDQDREVICKRAHEVASRKDHPVMVVHGTDTLRETALSCLKGAAVLKSPIVFTGAMKPPGFGDSDARQNVAEALLAARLLTAGVYVCFHNNVLPAALAVKDRASATFAKGAR